MIKESEIYLECPNHLNLLHLKKYQSSIREVKNPKFLVKFFFVSIFMSTVSCEIKMINIFSTSKSAELTIDIVSSQLNTENYYFSESSYLFEYIFCVDHTVTNVINQFDLINIPQKKLRIPINVTFDGTNDRVSFGTDSQIFIIHESQKRIIDSLLYISLFFGGNLNKNNETYNLIYISIEDNIFFPNFLTFELDSNIELSASIPLIKITLSKSSDHFVIIRNFILTNELILSSNNAFNQLFLGIAQLHNSIYFHLEPVNSKYLFSRSKLNLSPMINGSFNGTLGNIYSIFSEKKKQIEWLLFGNNFEYLNWKDFAVISSEEKCITVLINFTCFLRNKNLNYLNDSNSRDFSILSFWDENEVVILSVVLRYISFEDLTNKVFYSLVFFDNQNKQIENLLFQDFILKSEMKIPINSIKLSFIKTSISTKLLIKISKENSSNYIFSYLDIPSLLYLQKLKKLIIGKNQIDPLNLSPKFLLSLHDIQIFFGGMFFKSKSDPLLVESLSLNSIHPVKCDSNPYLLRLSHNPDFDKEYLLQIKNIQFCENRKINKNCNIQNCELCTSYRCLICRIPFYLHNGKCLDKTDFLKIMKYGVFSRMWSNNFDPFSVMSSYVILPDVDLDVSMPIDILYGEILYNFSSFETNQNYSLKFEVNGQIIFIPNKTSIDQSIIDLFSIEDQMIKFYFLIFPKTSIINLKSHTQSANIKLRTISNVCNKPQNLNLKDSIRSLFCPGMESNFSTFEYLTNSSASFLTTSYTIDSNFNSLLNLPCKNNCECRKNNSNLECESAQCKADQYHLTLTESPNISSCISCPSNCNTCLNGICTSCAASYFQKSSFNLSQFLGISFKECNNCHPICKFGCIGPSEKDCINCRNNCLYCDLDQNCKCNYKKGYKLKKYFSLFEVCKKEKCLQNCLICENKNICKNCKIGYKLYNNKCLKLKKEVKKNCLLEKNKRCINCEKGFFLNNFFKCSRCPSNCKKCLLKYDRIQCIKCNNDFQLSPQFLCYKILKNIFNNTNQLNLKCHYFSFYKKKLKKSWHILYSKSSHFLLKKLTNIFPVNNKNFCKFCSITNFENCLHNFCIKCHSNYFISKIKPFNCLPSLLNCKKCIFFNKCFECKEGYSLQKNKCKCILSENYADFFTGNCISCKKCNNCNNPECSKCKKCLKKCNYSIYQLSKNYFQILSNDLELIRNKFITYDSYDSENKLKNLKIFNYFNKNLLIIPNKTISSESIIIEKSFFKKSSCIAKNLKIKLNSNKKKSHAISVGLKYFLIYIQKIYPIILLICGLFLNPYYVQGSIMIIQFINFIQYGFVYSRQNLGLFGYFSQLNKNVYSPKNLTTMKKIQDFFLLFKTKEIYIPNLNFFGWKFLSICLFFICKFLLKSFCFLLKMKSNLTNNDFDYKKNNNIIKKLKKNKKKIPLSVIPSILKNSKKIKSTFVIRLIKIYDFLMKNHSKLILYFHSIICIFTSHGCARLIRHLKAFKFSISIFFTIIFYHMVLLYFYNVNYQKLKSLKKNVFHNLKKKKNSKIKEYILFRKNFILLSCISPCTYALVLFANNIPFVFVFLLIKFFILSIIFAFIKFFDEKEYRIIRLICPYNLFFHLLLYAVSFKPPFLDSIFDIFLIVFVSFVILLFIPRLLNDEKKWIQVVKISNNC